MTKRPAKRSQRSEPEQRARTVEPGTITSIEQQKGAATRYSIFVDGAFAFGIGRDLLLSSGIAKGEYLDRQRLENILGQDAIDRALSAAMRALEQRMQTTKELRTRLARKGFTSDAIDAALERLVSAGYLNDERFAEVWIENRLAFRPRGKRMLEMELRQKGVDREIVRGTIEELDIDDSAAALELATKRLRSVQGLPLEDQRRKLTGMLARRGFDYGTIRTTLDTVLGDPEMGDDYDDVV